MLCFLAIIESYKETSELILIPGLTEYRYYAAKKHASTEGCALPSEDSSHNRQRMEPTKLDQFLDFISYNNTYQSRIHIGYLALLRPVIRSA